MWAGRTPDRPGSGSPTRKPRRHWTWAADGRRIHDAADLLLHRVLIRDESAMAELLEAVLGPLVGARGGAEQLIDTLAAFFAAGGNASAAARALHLSVRALTYRLARIHELTGLDPGDPAAAYALATAVTGARLLGWRPA